MSAAFKEPEHATNADAAALARLHALSDAHPWDGAAYRRFLEMDHIFALKICEAGEIRGFIMLSCAGTEAEILMLAVTPAWRRQGLAQALIRKAAIFARVRGADRLFLEVGEDNGPARRLYDKLAFKEVGRRPGYYPRDIQPPVDAILLAGTLL